MAAATPTKKPEILSAVAEKAQVTKVQAEKVIDALLDLAFCVAKKEGEFTIPGLGKLSVVEKKARTGINPKTKEKIKIAAKKVAKMKLLKVAKDAIVPSKKAVKK